MDKHVHGLRVFDNRNDIDKKGEDTQKAKFTLKSFQPDVEYSSSDTHANNEDQNSHNTENHDTDENNSFLELISEESDIISAGISSHLVKSIKKTNLFNFHKFLLDNLGIPVYRSWIKPMVLVNIDNQNVKFSVPTKFKKTIISQRYIDIIYQSWKSNFFPSVNIEIIARESLLINANSSKIENTNNSTLQNGTSKNKNDKFINKNIDIDFIKVCTPLNENKNFSNFICSRTNQLAHSACDLISKKLEKGPLYIFGNSGCGKTHLLNAVGNEFKKNNPKANIIFSTHDNFTNSYVEAHLSSHMNEFVNYMMKADLFIIDDVHLLGSRKGSQKCLVQIIEHMINHGKPVVIAGSIPSSELINIGLSQRLIQRLRAGLCVRINEPSEKLKYDYILSYFTKSGLGEYLGSNVIETIVAELDGSMREVEGAARILILHLQNSKKKINPIQALEILYSQFGLGQKKIKIDQIVEYVVDVFGVSKTDIRSKRRHAFITKARHAISLLSKELTDVPYETIGNILNRDHSTIVAGVKRAEDLQRTDKIFAQKLESIRSSLEKN